MKSFNQYFLLVFLMSIGISLDAQINIQQDSTYIFEMKDGNVYIGKVVDFKGGAMSEVQTSVGNIKILQKGYNCH
ncbi:MAG: hypothetical protein IPJ13_02565 [Saprospiraceae bacterium]|nr:hypothetical protein [Saprospiraceae bacterium]